MKHKEHFPMDCQTAEKIMFENRWQELSEKKRMSFQKHISTCPRCRELQMTISKMERAIASSPLKPEPAIRERLLRHLRRQSSTSFFDKIRETLLQIMNYRIPVYQLGIGIIILFFGFIFVSKILFAPLNKTNMQQITKPANQNHELLQLNVLNVNEIAEFQKPSKSMKDDTLLTKLLYSAM